jgi:hypothetical protein
LAPSIAGIALASYVRGSALFSMLPMRGTRNAGHRCQEDWLMLLAKGLIMTGFVAVVLAPLHLRAETVARPGAATIAPSNAGARLTGKERLGEKWKDEQRVDNCKVPLDKQGPKRRPDSC